MPLVVKLPLAETDLEEIWWYIPNTTLMRLTGPLKRLKNAAVPWQISRRRVEAVTNCTPVCAACRLATTDLLLGG